MNQLYIYIYIYIYIYLLPSGLPSLSGHHDAPFAIQWGLVAAAAKPLQSCPTLCDPRDGSPPGSPIPGILQARTLELVATSFSNALKWKVKMKSLSRIGLLATPWTAAYQAPPSTGFSRQEYWIGGLVSYLFLYKYQQCICVDPHLPIPSTSPFPLDFSPFVFYAWVSISALQISEVSQLCLTLCGPMDCSPPGSSVHGIFQARILEWVAISFSRGFSRPRDGSQVSSIAGRRFTIWAPRESLYK